MSSIRDAEIFLSDIVALSPLNPRQDMTSDVSTLAATIRARGLLHPILVTRRYTGPDAYLVLAGGRRWRALRSLDAEDGPVRVRIFEGTEAEAREAALAESVTQVPLHPVDEFEAFSALERDGFDVPTIARDFALTEKHVRQRLALGRLSPRVREMWRRGDINRDIAQAFTAGPIETQEAALDEHVKRGGFALSAYQIHRAMRQDSVSDSEALGKFILGEDTRRNAYVAAGGRVEDDDLFSEQTILLDGAIARRVADALLLAEAERIAEAEGWGRASIADLCDDEEPEDITPDYTKAEQKKLLDVDLPDAEREAIEARALLRAIPNRERAMLGVTADFDGIGALIITRAVPLAPPKEEREAPPPPAPGKGERKSPPGPREPRQEEPEDPAIPPPSGGKEAEEILGIALGDALTAATARSLNLALAFTVATLGCSHGQFGISLDAETLLYVPRSELLGRINHMRFETALAIVATAPPADLTTAFAELIGHTIRSEEITPDRAHNLVALAERHVSLRADVAAALDYKALFLASPREEAEEAIRALDGEAAAAEAGKLRKPKLVERAALLAADRQWLPETLNALLTAAPQDTRSIAEAMVEAIERDEAAQKGAPGSDADERDRAMLDYFLDATCVRTPLGQIDVNYLHDAYEDFRKGRGPDDALDEQHFVDLLTEAGFQVKRLRKAAYVVGIALTANDQQRSNSDALALSEDRSEDRTAAETDREEMEGDAASAARDAAGEFSAVEEKAASSAWGDNLEQTCMAAGHLGYATFLRSHAAPAPGRHVGVDALDACFEAFRVARGLKKVSKGSQAAMLTELGFVKKKIDGRLSWQGLAVSEDVEARQAAE